MAHDIIDKTMSRNKITFVKIVELSNNLKTVNSRDVFNITILLVVCLLLFITNYSINNIELNSNKTFLS